MSTTSPNHLTMSRRFCPVTNGVFVTSACGTISIRPRARSGEPPTRRRRLRGAVGRGVAGRRTAPLDARYIRCLETAGKVTRLRLTSSHRFFHQRGGILGGLRRSACKMTAVHVFGTCWACNLPPTHVFGTCWACNLPPTHVFGTCWACNLPPDTWDRDTLAVHRCSDTWVRGRLSVRSSSGTCVHDLSSVHSSSGTARGQVRSQSELVLGLRSGVRSRTEPVLAPRSNVRIGPNVTAC